MRTPSILVTGGAGFIGSNFIQGWIGAAGGQIITIDKMTYASRAHDWSDAVAEGHRFVTGDIVSRDLIRELLLEHRPSAVINFAAETHVDRSIHYPDEFLQANVIGTFNLLDQVRHYWSAMPDAEK